MTFDRHSFPKIPKEHFDFRKYVECSCKNCGKIKRLYATGASSYKNELGKYESQTTKCEIQDDNVVKGALFLDAEEETRIMRENRKEERKPKKYKKDGKQEIVIDNLHKYPSHTVTFNHTGNEEKINAVVNFIKETPEVNLPVKEHLVKFKEMMVSHPTDYKIVTNSAGQGHTMSVEEVEKKMLERYEPKKNWETARLEESLVLINVMYEEIVSAGLRTKGRDMAGRFLYSQGYQETVKRLEKK